MSVRSDFNFRIMLHSVVMKYVKFYDTQEDGCLKLCEESEDNLIGYIDHLIESKTKSL